MGTERGLFRFDPARGLWVDRRGRANCGPGPIIKKCRADIPPVQRLDRAPYGDVYAATPGGVFRYDDPLSVCDPVKMATAIHTALSASKTPLEAPAAGNQPAIDLDTEQLDQIIGVKGQASVYQFAVPRRDPVTDAGMMITPVGPLGVADWR